MKILTHPNWKRKIAFDNIIYKDVKRYSLTLNSVERTIMDVQINFYRKHFSILQVMTHFKLLKRKEDRQTFIKAVLKRCDNIFYLPDSMLAYFKKKIRDEFTEYRAFFELLVEKASAQSQKNPIIDICKSIFGDYFKAVKRKLNAYRKVKEVQIVQKIIKPEGIENHARTLIHELQDDLYLASIYGRSSVRKTVPISIVNDYGYGEWISKKVTFNNDRLFIYSNNNKLTQVQLKHMIYFNVYPGYAHFYNNVVLPEKSPICFDNGAEFLINGWAMYTMCKSKNTAYSTNMLTEGATICHNLIKGNLAKGYEHAYIYLLGKYPKSKAMDYMVDYTQYPGHYLSYVMGAIGIELTIQKGFAHNPIDFLESIAKVNCGDFFAIYNPKEQKKIFKNNITARVAPKFNKYST